VLGRSADLPLPPAVAALERAEFPDGADEGMLARLWETDGGVILAAEEGDDLLGYVWARFVLDEGDIGNVAVAPDSRRPGIGAAAGTAILATKSGTVTTAAYSAAWGYYVVINHGDGYSSLYAHQPSCSVSVGDYVTQGQTIGYVGSTGWSTGPHLHFTIYYNGADVNPFNYIG